EDLDRSAVGLLREIGAGLGPRARRELAAETAADVIHFDLDVGGGNLQVGSNPAGPSRNILGGGPGVDRVALPLNHATVRLQADMIGHGNSVGAFADRLGILESLIG